MKLSVIIVNYKVKYFLEVCLHSVLRAAKGFDAEVIVVDNASDDGSVEMVREKFPSVVIIENKQNTGFSKANNQAVAIAKGAYILFLNPDTVMPEDFFVKTLGYLDAHPEAGSLGPKLLDGKGQYSPDGKKSFPTLSVAIFKTTGINKLFPKSTFFNKYYAVHVQPDEVAAVEVLSGCCMIVRSKLIQEIGGAFDEDYFMYCEDVDLAYRIQKSGHQNVYFPEATLIHYKGESTKKATLSYVRTFNEALVTFVKKHYSRQQAGLFVLFIKIGIMLRAVLGVIKQALKILRMPMFDALILLATLWGVKEFWVLEVKNILPILPKYVYATFPVYISLWIASLYVNGAYDQPYRALRVVRGMFTGTILILAYYGLLQMEFRYSRAIIILSGFIGTVLMLALHELLYRLGIFKFIPYETLPRKAVIVAAEDHYQKTAETLQQVHYAPDLQGRIALEPTAALVGDTIGDIRDMKQLLYTTGVDEVIFCVNGLSYDAILQQMQLCGDAYDYKIHLPGSQSFVGSNSSHTAGDLYTMDARYNLNRFAAVRNKRVFDILSALILICGFPVFAFFVLQPGSFMKNCLRVLLGRKTWVGYDEGAMDGQELPKIKPSVIPAYFMQESFVPTAEVKAKMNRIYAKEYTPGADFTLLLKNFRFLGKN